MIITSAVPTTNELAVISATLPSYFTLSSEEGRVFVTLNSPSEDPPATPLTTWVFTPGTAPDFAGDVLCRAILLLTGIVTTILRRMDDEGGPSLNSMMNCGVKVVFALRKGVLKGGELEIDIHRLHSITVSEWL